jgi:hypothetical protein
VTGAALSKTLVHGQSDGGLLLWTYSRTIPARDGADVPYMGETRDLAKCLPAVFCDQAVFAVRAGSCEEASVRVVVLGVVSNCFESDMFALIGKDSCLGQQMRVWRG